MKNNEYLTYTRRERTAIVALIVLMLFLGLGPGFSFGERAPSAVQVPKEWLASVTEVQTVHDTVPGMRSLASHAPAPGDRYASYRARDRPDGARPHQAVYRQKKVEAVDINRSDTSAWIALPGIGSKLAARIVLFRAKLGGFHSVEQIGEVYGLADSVYQRIRPLLRCHQAEIKKISLNTADKETLRQHPYIRWEIANALVSYRDQHGRYNSLDELAGIHNIEADALKKIRPYLMLN